MISAYRAQLYHRRDVAQEGLHLGVVRQHVTGEEKLFARGVGLFDTGLQLRQGVEIIITHAQRVARHTGVDRIGAVGDGVAQVLQVACRGEKFGSFHGHREQLGVEQVPILHHQEDKHGVIL